MQDRDRRVTLIEHSATFITYSIVELYCIASYSVVSSATYGYLIDNSATSKSPCREFSYKYVAVVHTEENSVINKSPCREFSCKQIILERVQLQTMRVSAIVQLCKKSPY